MLVNLSLSLVECYSVRLWDLTPDARLWMIKDWLSQWVIPIDPKSKSKLPNQPNDLVTDETECVTLAVMLIVWSGGNGGA